MRKPMLTAVLLVALAGSGSACGGDDKGAAAATTTAPPPARDSKTARPSTTVKVVQTRYGRILVDGDGRALYLFTREKGSAARCYGQCAAAWPVFHARGRLRAAGSADRGLLGTTARRDGTRQVTYAGHPLYYYVTDRKPGQVTCQDVTEFGGTWLVVAPSGRAVLAGR